MLYSFKQAQQSRKSSVCPVCQKKNIITLTSLHLYIFVFPVASTDSTFLSNQLKKMDDECLVNRWDNLKVKTQADDFI